jgi:hypothetical protein
MTSVSFWGIMQRRMVSFTDILGQRIHPIFKGQEVQEENDFLTLEDGTNMLSPNIGSGSPFDAA